VTDVPDAGPALVAVRQLADKIATVLRVAPSDPPDDATAAALAHLCGDLVVLADRALWARDAALALAWRDRRPLGHPVWQLLQDSTGVSDSTLSARLRAWRIANPGHVAVVNR
jgi:hypothetical protein